MGPNDSWEIGDGRTATLADMAELYRETLSRSIPSCAGIQKLDNKNYCIEASFKATDCDMMETVKTFKTYSLSVDAENKRINQVHLLSGPHDLSVLMSVTSDNHRYTARLKSGSGTGGDTSGSKKQILEIWDRSRLLKTIDIGEVNVHGPINTDSQFSRMLWSKSGNQDKLLYVCQAKKRKPLQPFKKTSTLKYANGKNDVTSTGGKDGDGKDNNDDKEEDYLYREDWGETLDGVEHTILAILDVEDEKFKIITIEMEKFSLGQPFWLDNCTKVGSVGWLEEPRHIGLVYCNNRPSKIYIHDWLSAAADVNHENLVAELSLEGRSLHSPRVNNAGNQFLYLVNYTWGAHYHATELYMHDLRERKSKKMQCILSNSKNTFPRTVLDELFIQDLPVNCFASDNKHVLFTTYNNLFSQLALYNIETKILTKIEFPNVGVSLLEFKYDLIVASGSDINITPTIYVAKLNLDSVPNEAVAWHQIENCHHYDDVDYVTRTIQVPTTDSSGTQSSREMSEVSFILVKPVGSKISEKETRRAEGGAEPMDTSTSANTLPTIVHTHGGPHSSFTLSFMVTPILYAKLGCRTMLINYRGSTGVSQDYVKMLNGHIGTMDVNDCCNCIKYAVDQRLIDSDKLVLSGGSHGGFLACHLSGVQSHEWGFDFKCALIRNPVTEPYALSMTSDIPDWAFNQTLAHQEFKHGWFPDADTVKLMYETAPLIPSRSQHRIPTLMLLGNKDRRVPMSQGLRWYEMLKAQGMDAKCKVYTDNHSLSRTDSAADSFLSSCMWMFEHLSRIKSC